MGAFFVYILKSSICLALFYLFYRLLLSRETFHRFNRLAVLSLMILSCLIPLIQLTVNSSSDVSMPLVTIENLMVNAVDNSEADHQRFLFRESLLLVYALGVVFFLLRNVWSVFHLWKLIRSGEIHKESDGVNIVVHKQNIAPFSWMNYIIISENDLSECGEEILTHERAHIRACHSLDLLVADICIFLQWFNPAAWLLKRELQNIHEYEADESVISYGVKAKDYQLLLIRKAVGTRLYSMANSFNHSSLKKRITMMMKKKSNPWARVKYLYVLSVAAIAVAAFARPEVSNELNEISAVKVNDLSAIVKTETVKSTKNVETAPQTDAKLKVVKVVGVKKDSTSLNDATVVALGKTTDSKKAESKSNATANPLLLIDGKKSTNEELQKIDPAQIESIKVLKDEESKKVYGAEDKGGVVIVTTKKK